MEKIFDPMHGPVPRKDIHTPLSLRIGANFMKDAHSAESNEKSFFRFLIFELWLIVFTIYSDVPPTKNKKVVQNWSNSQET